MSILHYFPTLNPSTQDIKQHARNLLLISAWFQQSPVAQNLKLSHALEWVAKAYGFNSYAAYTANPNPLNNTPVVKAKLHEIIKHDHPADTLFLKTAHSYLVTPVGCLNKFPIYIEPTALLLAVIEKFVSNYESDLFFNLAAMNALGMGIYRNRVELTQADAAIVDACPVGGLVKKLIRYSEIINYNDEVVGMDWGLKFEHLPKSVDPWVDLNLFFINRPISIELPIPNNAELAKLLNAKTILSAEFESRLMDDLYRFTQEKDEVFKEHRGGYDNQPDSEGIYIEYDFDSACNYHREDSIQNGCVRIQDFISLEIKYLDQSGQEKECVLRDELINYSFCMTKNGFRFTTITNTDTPFEEYNVMHLLVAKLIQTLEKHQYILANIWASSGAEFEVEKSQTNHLKTLISEIEAQVEDEVESFRQEIFGDMGHYFDQALLDEIFAPLKQYDVINQSKEHHKALQAAYEDDRLQKRLNEILDNRKTALRGALYLRHNINGNTKGILEFVEAEIEAEASSKCHNVLLGFSDYFGKEVTEEIFGEAIRLHELTGDFEHFNGVLEKACSHERFKAVATEVVDKHVAESRKKLYAQYNIQQ